MFSDGAEHVLSEMKLFKTSSIDTVNTVKSSLVSTCPVFHADVAEAAKARPPIVAFRMIRSAVDDDRNR